MEFPESLSTTGRSSATAPEKRSDRICVIGLGEVGLKFAGLAARAGYTVVGVDKSAERRAQATPVGLERSGYEFEIPNLHIGAAPEQAGVYVLCVDSPVDPVTRHTDLANLKAAVESVGSVLTSGDLVIVRSTVPVGTTRAVVDTILAATSGLASAEYRLAFAPERTSTGMRLDESTVIPHLVGGRDVVSSRLAAGVLETAGMRSLVMESLEAAELGKLASNAARDTALALATQVRTVAELHNIDVEQLVEDVNFDYPRDHVKMPRPGVGGSCLTKDSYILAESLPVPLDETLFGVVRRINDQAQAAMIDGLRTRFAGRMLSGDVPRVMISGAAFKGRPPTRDTRNAVSLTVGRELRELRFQVRVFDPMFDASEISELGFEPTSIDDEAWDCDVLLLFSNHQLFSDRRVVRSLVRRVRTGGFIYDPYRWCTPMFDAMCPGTTYRTLSTEVTVAPRS